MKLKDDEYIKNFVQTLRTEAECASSPYPWLAFAQQTNYNSAADIIEKLLKERNEYFAVACTGYGMCRLCAHYEANPPCPEIAYCKDCREQCRRIGYCTKCEEHDMFEPKE